MISAPHVEKIVCCSIDVAGVEVQVVLAQLYPPDKPDDGPKHPSHHHSSVKLDPSSTPANWHVPHNTYSCHSNGVSIAKNVTSSASDRAAQRTTESMSDREPQLTGHSTALHGSTRREPHVDSEEAVQFERRRVSRELEPIHHHDFARERAEELDTARASGSLRSRNASSPSPDALREHLRRQGSDTSTQPDVPGASIIGARSTRSLAQVPHWYDPVAKFWRTHVSLTIEEGAHRDHLGTSIDRDDGCTETDLFQHLSAPS